MPVIAMVDFSSLSITPDMIVDFLKHEVRFKDTCYQILNQQIVNSTSQERGIVVTSAEIQAEADRQRYQMRLESADATFTWLNEQMITPEDWEAGIHDRLLSQKLAEALFAQEVEKYFVEHRLDFEEVSLYQVTVPYEQLSQELLYQIEENEISFYEAAHLYDVEEQRRLQCGYAGRFYRWRLKPEITAILFSTRPGEVIGPLKSEHGYDLLLADEFTLPELTPEIRQTIIDKLFREWLSSELDYLLHN